MNTVSTKTSFVQSLVFTCILIAANVSAHEGHDRSASQTKTPAVSYIAAEGKAKGSSTTTLRVISAARSASANAPRFVANSPDFEMVGLVEGNKLTLWLDHVKTNMPVVTGVIDIEIGETRLQPQLAGEVWVATLPAGFAPGTLPITATITTEGMTDLLAGEFVETDPEAVISSAPGLSNLTWTLAIAGVIALVVSGAALRRRLAGPRF